MAGSEWLPVGTATPAVIGSGSDGDARQTQAAAGNGSSGSATGRRLLLRLGLTDYRQYVGTNLRPPSELAALIAAGKAEHNDPRAHLGGALGCETMLLTADDCMVPLNRSGAVATHTGQYNGPSGHPEPSNVAGLENGQEVESGGGWDKLVLQELFESVRQETHEETNIPIDALEPPLLLGAMAETATGKPDLLFLSRTRLTVSEVEAVFKEGAPDAWESEGILMCD